MRSSGVLLTSLWFPIGLFGNFFYSFPSWLLEYSTAIHVKLCMKIETGWIWSGGAWTKTKDTRTEMCGDGEGATVKDDAAIVKF